MTTTLTSLTGKVHHAVGLVDGTACNGIGAARGNVRWYTRKGAVTCKACLKVIAKAHDEALACDATLPAPVAVPQPVRSAGSSTLPQVQRTPSGAPHVATPVVRTRKPQINHKACAHPGTPRARRACRKAQRAASAAPRPVVAELTYAEQWEQEWQAAFLPDGGDWRDEKIRDLVERAMENANDTMGERGYEQSLDTSLFNWAQNPHHEEWAEIAYLTLEYLRDIS